MQESIEEEKEEEDKEEEEEQKIKSITEVLDIDSNLIELESLSDVTQGIN